MTSFQLYWPVCLFKFPFKEKASPQISHANGFSPVWLLMWLLRLKWSLKHFWQKLQIILLFVFIGAPMVSSHLGKRMEANLEIIISLFVSNYLCSFQRQTECDIWKWKSKLLFYIILLILLFTLCSVVQNFNASETWLNYIQTRGLWTCEIMTMAN